MIEVVCLSHEQRLLLLRDWYWNDRDQTTYVELEIEGIYKHFDAQVSVRSKCVRYWKDTSCVSCVGGEGCLL